MDINTIKIISSLFSIIGSIILAYRVTGILHALSIVADAHEVTIDNLVSAHRNPQNALVHLGNSTANVEKAKKLPLLIAGFTFIILAAVLQLVALAMQNGLLVA